MVRNTQVTVGSVNLEVAKDDTTRFVPFRLRVSKIRVGFWLDFVGSVQFEYGSNDQIRMG